MDEILKLHYKALGALHEKKYENATDLFLSLEMRLHDMKPSRKSRSDYNTVCLSTYRCLGEILQLRESFRDAVTYFIKAAKLDENDLTLWFSMGKCAFDGKNFELSIVAFKQVLKINPKHLLALDAGIPIAVALERYSDALLWATTLFELRQNSITARMCLKWMRENTKVDIPSKINDVIHANLCTVKFSNKVEKIQSESCDRSKYLSMSEKVEYLTLDVSKSLEDSSEQSFLTFFLASVLQFFNKTDAPQHVFGTGLQLIGLDDVMADPGTQFCNIGENDVDFEIFISNVESGKLNKSESVPVVVLDSTDDEINRNDEVSQRPSEKEIQAESFNSSDNEVLAHKQKYCLQSVQKMKSCHNLSSSEDSHLTFDPIGEKTRKSTCVAKSRVQFLSLSSESAQGDQGCVSKVVSGSGRSTINNDLGRDSVSKTDEEAEEKMSTSTSASGSNFLDKILKDLKTSVRYDGVEPSAVLEISNSNTVTTRNQDPESGPVSTKLNKRISMDPVYGDLIKFLPLNVHPTDAIRNEQLFSPELLKSYIDNVSGDDRIENFDSGYKNVLIHRRPEVAWNELKSQYKHPNRLFFDLLKMLHKMWLKQNDRIVYDWMYRTWRSSLPITFMMDAKDIDDNWHIIAYTTEFLVISEFLTFECVKEARFKKSVLKAHRYLPSDVDFLVNFVHVNSLKFGKSYHFWCFRSTFLSGVFSLLTMDNITALQHLNFALLNLKCLNCSWNVSAISYDFGDNLSLVVNEGYLENLLVQVKLRFASNGGLEIEKTVVGDNDKGAAKGSLENSRVIDTLEPVLNSLTEAKKDVATLVSNLRLLKNNLSMFWSSNPDLTVERKSKYALIQLRVDIATIELYLGSYVFTKERDFDSLELSYHLEHLEKYSEYLFELTLEYKMRLAHCMLTILHITINRAKCLPVNGLNVVANSDELEKLRTLIVQTAHPWVILAKLIELEENSVSDKAGIFTHLSPESAEESQVPMFIKFLMEGHEYYKDLGFCYFSGGILMHRIIESLSKFLYNQSLPISPHYKKVYEEEIDQCYFCLYQLKRAKAKTEQHCSEYCVLEKAHLDRVYRYFVPSERPSFNNKKSRLTNDEATMLKKILELCWNDFQQDSELISRNFEQSCEKSSANDFESIGFPDAQLLVLMKGKVKPCVVEILHFLADHYMHLKETATAVPFYILTLFFDPKNIDCCVSLSLCRKALIEFEYLDTENFTPISKVVKAGKSLFLCFRVSLHHLKDQSIISMLNIELGMFYYQLCSFIRRSEDFQQDRELSNAYAVKTMTEQFYNEAENCFREAFKLSAFEDRWLCHYMLGKIAQKQNPPNLEPDLCDQVLTHYLSAIQLLEQMGAKLPRKITVQTPQQHSVEILEMIYRLFASAIKMLDKNNCSVIFNFMQKVMLLPVIEKHLVKDEESADCLSQSHSASKVTKGQSLATPMTSKDPAGLVVVSSDDSSDCATQRSKFSSIDVNKAKNQLLSWSLEVFKNCARRYARHAKSLYRLAEITRTKLRNVEGALKFLYFPDFANQSNVVLQPLLSFNVNYNTVTFSTIYRPNCHEVDRCGSYYHLVGKSVLAAVDMLVQVGALDELAVFAKSLSKSGDKFYMHEPVRVKLYHKTVIAFLQIAQRELDTLPKTIEKLGCKEQSDAQLSFKLLTASIYKFLQLRLPLCTEDYVIHHKLKKIMMKCYFRCTDDLDYASSRDSGSQTESMTFVNPAAQIDSSKLLKTKQSATVESMCDSFAQLCVLGTAAKFGTNSSKLQNSQNWRPSYRAKCCATVQGTLGVAQGVDQLMRSKVSVIAKRKRTAATLQDREETPGTATDRSKVPKGFRSSMLNQK